MIPIQNYSFKMSKDSPKQKTKPNMQKCGNIFSGAPCSISKPITLCGKTADINNEVRCKKYH